jgi:hypothetical protein
MLIPYKKTITGHEAVELFLVNVWINFGLPSSIVFDWDSKCLSSFIGCSTSSNSDIGDRRSATGWVDARFALFVETRDIYLNKS